jgi:hypothetical protein
VLKDISEPGQKNSGHFPKLETKGIHHIPEYYTDCYCTSIGCESGKKFGNSCCRKLDIKEIHHQLWNFLGSLLVQNLGDFTVHREKTMFLYFHNETYVLINMSESITIFLWLNCYSVSSLTVFVFQVLLPIDFKFLSNIR